MDYISNILLAIIPLFIAMDALGNLPIFLGITAEMNKSKKKIVLKQAITTAALVIITFSMIGKLMFKALDITENDFKIAGGIILLILAVKELLKGVESQDTSFKEGDTTMVGIVPLGVPLIAGPATLATVLLINDTYGTGPMLFSITVNLFIIWFVFKTGEQIARVVGNMGLQVLAKLMYLLLASIAVMLIRKGLEVFINQ
jgi:multiple antibiotic resistance protein